MASKSILNRSRLYFEEVKRTLRSDEFSSTHYRESEEASIYLSHAIDSKINEINKAESKFKKKHSIPDKHVKRIFSHHKYNVFHKLYDLFHPATWVLLGILIGIFSLGISIISYRSKMIDLNNERLAFNIEQDERLKYVSDLFNITYKLKIDDIQQFSDYEQMFITVCKDKEELEESLEESKTQFEREQLDGWFGLIKNTLELREIDDFKRRILHDSPELKKNIEDMDENNLRTEFLEFIIKNEDFLKDHPLYHIQCAYYLILEEKVDNKNVQDISWLYKKKQYSEYYNLLIKLPDWYILHGEIILEWKSMVNVNRSTETVLVPNDSEFDDEFYSERFHLFVDDIIHRESNQKRTVTPANFNSRKLLFEDDFPNYFKNLMVSYN